MGPPKLRKFLERIFGQILVKKFLDHITLLGPPDLSKNGPFCKKQRFLHLPIVSCGFTSIKCVFLVRKVSFRLLLVLETLDQPKISRLKAKFSRVAHYDFRAFNLSLQNFRCYS